MINPYKSVDWNPSPEKIRRTLALVAVLFLIAGVLLYLKFPAAAMTWRVVLLIFFIMLSGILFPPLGKWVFRIWFGVACAMGFCVSNLVLCVCFYGVITPLALIRRFSGGEPLPLKHRKDSNWSDHPEKTDPGSYFHQF